MAELKLKKRNLGTLVSEVVLLLASAFLLSLAFPGPVFKQGLGFMVYFALIPLFAVVRNTKWSIVGLYGFFYGFVYYWIFNYWLASFHPLANYIVQIIKGAEMVALFFALKAADSWIEKRFAPLAQACIWVAYTYLSQSWFAGYPYGTIAYALYNYRLLIQIADFSGIWLLNFIIVLPQAYAGQWACSRFSNAKGFLKSNIIVFIAYAVLVVFQVVYGIITLSYWNNAQPDKTFKAATIQHNVNSNWEGGLSDYQKNLHNLERLSYQALLEDPDCIIWSETAFVSSVYWYTTYPYEGDTETYMGQQILGREALVEEFKEFYTTLGVPLITGNPQSELADGATQPYDEDGNWNRKDYNSVLLLDENGIEGVYLKQHLVPFTEHFPYEKTLPHLYKFLLNHDYQWWEEGSESTVFTFLDDISFSTPICFEDIFGYLCADFVKNGADVLINLSNDSWSGSAVAMRQHGTMAVFRAIENRKTVLRSTNNGYSCLILPTGKIAGDVEEFTMGYTIWTVPVYESETYGTTVYTQTGDLCAKIFTYISYACLVYAVAMGITKKVKEKRSKLLSKNA